MPQLKTSVKKFLRRSRPKDQVTLTAFNDNMFTLTRRDTHAGAAAPSRRSSWRPGAAPRCTTSSIRGLQQLSKQPGRRVLVVFSDGDDKSSHSTLAAVERAVRSSDATLFMVALGSGVRNATIKSSIERTGGPERRPRAVRRADATSSMRRLPRFSTSCRTST